MTVNQAALLKDLRKQVTALEEDLRERTESEPEYREVLEAEYKRAHEAKRTAATYGAWRDDRVTQAAVAWILATVFVRFCEDNDLIADPWIAGPGERLVVADERHQRLFREHPEKNDRDWLIAAFDHLAGTNETVAGLFDRNHNPLWELEPSYEAASELLKFWRRVGPEGLVVHDFADPDLETRFLGDLYQDLSTHARKTYALLQTPEFVEEFILDLTLEPAVKEFGLEPLWKHRPVGWPGDPDEPLRGLRTIDPACGSGHFLLGIFHRLLAKWDEQAPNLDKWERIRRTLETVHGCDKNPFATEIARFRLLIAALKAANETRLDQAPVFPVNVAVGDSLLHGRGATSRTPQLFGEEAFRYRAEDVDDYVQRCDLLGVHSYHVVVGNPPYITAKDKSENESYRAYESVGGAYALSVPFAERIFELAIRTGSSERDAGYTGQITANSFMKREFGKKLIDWFHRKVDLTHVIDSSGAFIPGHGTPTVILAGRNRYAFGNSTIRVVQGMRGEPAQPDEPEQGAVWNAILDQVSRPGSESEWVSVADLKRDKLRVHPWSLTGGGASDLVLKLEASGEVLGGCVSEIGRTTHTGMDDAFSLPPSAVNTLHLGDSVVQAVQGDGVRDHLINSSMVYTFFPYDSQGNARELSDREMKFLWPNRTVLRRRIDFGATPEERGIRWFDHSMFFPRRFRVPFSIAYGEVATHNHFAFDHGGRLFKQTAPAIKLPEDADEDAYLGLLGLLNSSIGCFWLKQVSHLKGGSGVGRGIQDELWEARYAFNATRLEQFPLPRERPIVLAKTLDRLASARAALDPNAVKNDIVPTRRILDQKCAQDKLNHCRMIALQEELDWSTYGHYDLLSEADIRKVTVRSTDSIPPVDLGGRAFEIVLARKARDGEVTTAWFERHGSTPLTEIPEHWPEGYRRVVQARIDLIEKRPKDIGLLERPEYKRRWFEDSWEKKERAALRSWILDRCERGGNWYSMRDGFRQPRTMTIAQLADQFSADVDMQSVAALYANDHMGKSDISLETVLAEVIDDQHVPYLAALRYTDAGLRKRAEWEHVWERQREEDRIGRRLNIPVPPKYNDKDFRNKAYWSQRGKLDVPQERFISYLGATPESDGTLLLGWAGWDHKDQAQALVNIVNDRTEQAAWETKKITPLLAGLFELMPWVHQWHGEYDSEWSGVPSEEFQAFLNEQRAKHHVSEQDLKAWCPVESGRSGRKKKSER